MEDTTMAESKALRLGLIMAESKILPPGLIKAESGKSSRPKRRCYRHWMKDSSTGPHHG